MSLPRTPKGVKLAMSFIFSRGEDFTAAVAEAEGKYGPLDLVSEPFSFHFTDYYEKEMGKGSGSSKKEAQQNASQKALETIEVQFPYYL